MNEKVKEAREQLDSLPSLESAEEKEEALKAASTLCGEVREYVANFAYCINQYHLQIYH